MPHLTSPAKVNLFLEVLGKRRDGYHDLESVFLAVDLADRLSAEPRPDGRITMETDAAWLPTDERNLVVAAARRLRRECGEEGTEKGIHFVLKKTIPAGAGLGGGSSNAAAALRLADTVWKTDLPAGALARLAADIGSDVPFFLHGGLCLCRGRGEVVEPLAPFPAGVPLTLILTPLHSDTAAAYRGLSLPAAGKARKADAFLRALAIGHVAAMTASAFNRFETTVFAALPTLGDLHARLTRAGLAPRMSGSGSALWYFGRAAAVERAMADDPGLGGAMAAIEARVVQVGGMALK